MPPPGSVSQFATLSAAHARHWMRSAGFSKSAACRSHASQPPYRGPSRVSKLRATPTPSICRHDLLTHGLIHDISTGASACHVRAAPPTSIDAGAPPADWEDFVGGKPSQPNPSASDERDARAHPALTGCTGAGTITVVSRTGGTASDSGVLYGHPVDPDLRKQTRPHWPDALYATTDQKVGGSSPSERARPEALSASVNNPLDLRTAVKYSSRAVIAAASVTGWASLRP